MSDGLPVLHEEYYIGDGLFVSFDGYQILLLATRIDGIDCVTLEPSVYVSLRRWIAQFPRLASHMGEDARP